MRILVLNSGSSSIKYKLFDTDGERVIAEGHIADIGGQSPEPAAHSVANHDEGLRRVFAALADADVSAIDAVGHRVVHGGDVFAAPTVIDDAVCDAIGECADLAPLHNPANLSGIEAARRMWPDIPQVAVFDTAFHRTIPPLAATYPLPRDLAERHHIRRYGFHGTSCAWSLAAASNYLQRPANSLNLIVAHLGAGASVTAIREGRSVDCSMGFTPLEGLMMQTRSGDIDPAIVTRLAAAGMSVEAIDDVLHHQSGIGAIAGEADMRAVEEMSAAGDAGAQLAREMFAYRVAKYVGAYAGLAWPLHALVFTGGIGENDSWVRRRVCEWVPQLALDFDRAANEERRPEETVRRLRAGPTGPDILIVAADEERQILREAIAALGR